VKGLAAELPAVTDTSSRGSAGLRKPKTSGVPVPLTTPRLESVNVNSLPEWVLYWIVARAPACAMFISPVLRHSVHFLAPYVTLGTSEKLQIYANFTEGFL